MVATALVVACALSGEGLALAVTLWEPVESPPLEQAARAENDIESAQTRYPNPFMGRHVDRWRFAVNPKLERPALVPLASATPLW